MHSVRAVPEAATAEEPVLLAAAVLPAAAITEAATAEEVITEEVATAEAATTEEAITGVATTEEVATTMAEVRTSSLAGPSGSLTTPILTAIIRMVTPIPILTLTSILIIITPLRMTNLRCMSNLSNHIPGITVGIQEGITRTSRVVLAAGQK